MEKTPKYEFGKPDQNDFYDVDVFNNNMEKVETAMTEFDDTGTVAEIKSFPEMLTKLVTGNKLAVTLRNLKAGLQFVLHAGSIVNNCVTDNPNLPLSAAQGKALMDLYNVLNTKTKLSKGEVLNFRYIGAALLGSTSILYFTMYIKKFAALPTIKLNGTCVIQYENIVIPLDVSKITAAIIDSNGILGQVMISMDISSETNVKNIPVGVDISLTITGN